VKLHALAKRNGIDEPIVAHGRELGGQIREELISRVVCVEPVEKESASAPPVLAPLGAPDVETTYVTRAHQPVDTTRLRVSTGFLSSRLARRGGERTGGEQGGASGCARQERAPG
jgi:hypothetical protein